IEDSFGKVSITYGFTSPELLRHILKHSPGDMAPEIVQHASMEFNTRGSRICKRDGASCDFYVEGYQQRMDVIARFIVNSLHFDRLYFYGKTNQSISALVQSSLTTPSYVHVVPMGFA